MQAEENSSSTEYQVFKQNAGRKNNTYLRWNLLKHADQDSQFDKLVAKSDVAPTVKGNKEENCANKIDDTENSAADNSSTNDSIINDTLSHKKETPEKTIPASEQKATSDRPLLKPRVATTFNNGSSILDKLAGRNSATSNSKTQSPFSKLVNSKIIPNNKDNNKAQEPKKASQHTISFSLQAKALEAQQRAFDLKKKVALDKNKASISSMLEHHNKSSHSATPDIHEVLQSKIGAKANGITNLYVQMQNEEPLDPSKPSSISEMLKQKDNKSSPKITISNSEKKHIDFSLRAKALEAAQRSRELKLNILATKGLSIKESLKQDLNAQKEQQTQETAKVSANSSSTTENKPRFDIRPVSQQGQFSALFTCKNKETSVPNEASLKDIFHRIESCQ